jgi:hypothetical protein
MHALKILLFRVCTPPAAYKGPYEPAKCSFGSSEEVLLNLIRCHNEKPAKSALLASVCRWRWQMPDALL